jgi:hypothetical protein
MEKFKSSSAKKSNNPRKTAAANDKAVVPKKKRRAKDPDAPKRPLGAYFFYFKENNSKIKSENMELNQKSVVARIAADWKQLTDEQKLPFVELSNADKARYVREKKVYEETKAKKEEEEDKQNGWRQKRTKKIATKEEYDNNGNSRISTNFEYDFANEPEIRLVDVIGIDQMSFASSEDFAAYSPPRSVDMTRNFKENEVHTNALNEADFKEEVGSNKNIALQNQQNKL